MQPFLLPLICTKEKTMNHILLEWSDMSKANMFEAIGLCILCPLIFAFSVVLFFKLLDKFFKEDKTDK
jgi:hypothetical protein